jgi:hypothetical protein
MVGGMWRGRVFLASSEAKVTNDLLFSHNKIQEIGQWKNAYRAYMKNWITIDLRRTGGLNGTFITPAAGEALVTFSSWNGTQDIL